MNVEAEITALPKMPTPQGSGQFAFLTVAQEREAFNAVQARLSLLRLAVREYLDAVDAEARDHANLNKAEADPQATFEVEHRLGQIYRESCAALEARESALRAVLAELEKDGGTHGPA